MRRILYGAIIVLVIVTSISCYLPPPEGPAARRTYEGAQVGSVAGAMAGAILDHRNPWRGAVIGGTLGGIIFGTITDISQRAAMEAAHEGKTVWYRTEDGRGLYEAMPVPHNAGGRCTRIIDRVWVDGRLVRETQRDACPDRSTDRGYR